jgi:hypothetical protein
MKKVLLVVLAFLFVNVQAKDELTRKILNIEQKTFTISIMGHDIPSKILFPNEKDDAVIQVVVNDVKSVKKFYERQSFIYQYFLKNYKIGKTNGKKNLVFWVNDEKYMSTFRISLNNLKLLNKRDFGDSDGKKLSNGGFVYPIKTILRKGKFTLVPSALSISKDKLNLDFQKYLDKHSFGLYETLFETEYLEKKKKK